MSSFFIFYFCNEQCERYHTLLTFPEILDVVVAVMSVLAVVQLHAYEVVLVFHLMTFRVA